MKWLTLSVHQPFARAIVTGRKTIENRDWTNPRRGLLFIHATKQDPLDVGFVYLKKDIVNSAIIGYAYVRDVIRYNSPKHFANLASSHLCKPPENYEWQLYGWCLSGAIAFREPVPCRGYQKLWYVSRENRRAVFDQMQPQDRGIWRNEYEK